MGWSEKYKKSIDCDNPKGFSQKAHCASRKKTVDEAITKDVKFSKFSHKTPHLKGKQHQLDPNLDLKQLVHHSAVQYVDRDADGDVDVFDNPKKKTPDENPVDINVGSASKKLIAKQKGEIKHTKRGMAYEGNLRQWFKGSKSKDGKPGWVNVVTGDTCASDKPGEGVPKCVSSSKRASMTPAERRAAAARKRAKDPGQQAKSGAAKPTYVSTDSPKKKMNEESDIKGKGSGKKDACYHKVKSRFKVWPSAYASGALVKCRKKGASNWGNKSEETNYGSLPDWEGPMNDGEQRYCPKCEKMETSSECRYGPKYWSLFSLPSEPTKQEKYNIAKIHPANTTYEEKDHEYSMARSELSTIITAANKLKKKMGKGEGNIEAWVQSKITKAADYIDTAADYVSSGEAKEEKLVDKILDEILSEKCWVGYKQVGLKKKGKKMVPNCVPESISIEDAQGKKFAEVVDLIKPEPLKPSEGIGSKLIGEQTCPVCGFDPCQCLEGSVSESVRIPSKTGNIVLVSLVWRGKYFMMKLFFPQVLKPTKQEVQDQISKVYPGARVQSYQISDIKPGEQFLQVNEAKEIEEDWQSVNRKDKTDGLSQAAVNAYRRENPGSKLKTAVTEKNPTGKRASRRKSFCARMGGMKKRLTSAETARDPDSRINKALRRWNCN